MGRKTVQHLNFAYGNLAASTNHRPIRRTFLQLWREYRLGTDREFDAWAENKIWRCPVQGCREDASPEIGLCRQHCPSNRRGLLTRLLGRLFQLLD